MKYRVKICGTIVYKCRQINLSEIIKIGKDWTKLKYIKIWAIEIRVMDLKENPLK